MLYLHDLIDNTLDYPEDLIKEGIEGTVTATIKISASGQFLKEESRIESNSRFLRLAVIRAFRKAFDVPLPSSKRFQQSVTTIKATFEFVITHEDATSRFPKRVVSSIGSLSFLREHHIKLPFQLERPLFAEQTGQTGPIPSFDVLWLVDKIGTLFSKKVDVLQKYRDDPEY